MRIILIILALVFFCGFAYAEPSNLARSEQATLSLVAGGYDSNGNISLGLNYKLKQGWHIYWRTPGDAGYPMTLDWSKSKNIASQEFFWPAPARHRTKISGDNYSESYNYEDEILFPIIIHPKNNKAITDIKLHVNYAVCNDTCIPAEADLLIDIPKNYKNEQEQLLINKYISLVPKENGSFGINIEQVSLAQNVKGEKYFIINVTSEKNLDDAEIFIEGSNNFAFYNPTVSSNTEESLFYVPITVLAKDSSLEGQNFTVTLKNDNESIVKTVAYEDILVLPMRSEGAEDKNYTLELIILFAFLGGLILNVMPCVLPVLSIKLLGVIKHGGGSKAHIASSFVVTAIGIIFSFLLLAGLIIILKSIGMNVGWGFHFQEPLFIITMVVLLTLFAANMWGFFEFKIPSIGGNLYNKSLESSNTGNFLTGVLATVLATPCTAPFLGTAVGFALAQGTFAIITIFFAMGVGLASPYLLLSLYPQLVAKLPKPGKWMIKIKIILGWILAATAVWFIWILSNQIGKAAGLILLALAIIKLLKLWAAKHIRFFAQKHVKYPVLITIIALAFILPIHLSNHHHPVDAKTLWQPFEEEKIEELVDEGKVVLVDVTADWCLTCKVNKFTVLETKEMQAIFANENVIPMQADWTNKNRNIYNFIKKYGRAGIPFNIIYGPEAPQGIILSELLSKQDVIDAIKKAKNAK
jgi:suppressor for copper-sensitivity B